MSSKKKPMSRHKNKRKEKNTVAIVYFMLRHLKLMSQYKARLKNKKFCCDKKIYVMT